MSKIYIIGHRNPDLDSICSALAYADLKNQLDKDNLYIPVRCGHLSPSSKNILSSLDNIVEIIDHHRLDAIKTNLPIFIDAEPLGSTCTIVYELYVRNGLVPSKEIAKILLTGMMADTLVLKSPTTTPTDVKSAKALSSIIGEGVTHFGHEMFSHMESLSKMIFALGM